MIVEREDIKPQLFVLPDLTGPGGNVYFLLGQAKRVFEAAGAPESMWSEFYSEATSGDYEHALETISDWFTIVRADPS